MSIVFLISSVVVKRPRLNRMLEKAKEAGMDHEETDKLIGQINQMNSK